MRRSRILGSRRGTSLLEAVITITLSATLITVAVGWIHQSFKLSSLMKQRQNHHQLLMVLGRQFRSDVHQADDVMLESDQRLILTLPENIEVKYEVTDHTVVRSSQRGENESGPSPTGSETWQPRREVFALMPGSEVQWSDAESPRWMTMNIRRSRGVVAARPDGAPQNASETKSDAPTDLHVRAAIGRSRSIASDGGPEE